jgi:O-antigen/teichoic acid export membrane protein
VEEPTPQSSSLLSRFVGGALAVGLGNVATLVLGLLSTMVAARHVLAGGYGAFVLLGVVAGLLAQLSGFGLDLSVTKSIAGTEDGQQKRELVNTAVLFRLLTISAVGLVALIAGLKLPTLFGSSIPSSLVVFIPLLLLLESSRNLLRSILQGFFLFRSIATADSIDAFVNFGLTLAFVLFLDRGAIGLIEARLISSSLSCAFAYFSIPVKKRLEFHLDPLKGMLRFGFPLYINDILTFSYSRIDTLIIGALLGPAEIAYYAIAQRIPSSLQRLYEAFRVVYFSFMSKLFGLGEQSEAERLLNHSTRLVSFVTALGALIALVFGADIIVLVFSEQYLPSVPAFIVLMIGLSITLVSNVLGTSLVAVGESDKPPIINAVHMVVSLSGNVLLIPRLGIFGAALASLSGPSVTNPLNTLFLRRRGMDVRVREYLKPFLLLGAHLLLVLLFRPVALLHRISIVGLFIVSCFAFSVITREDIGALLNEGRRTLLRLRRELPLRGAHS